MLRPSMHRVDNARPLFGRKQSQMVSRVGVGANYFRRGQIRVLGALPTVREYALRVLSVPRGSALCTLGVPSCPYPQYSQYFEPSTSINSQYFRRQHSNTLTTRTAKCQYSDSWSAKKTYILRVYIHCVLFFMHPVTKDYEENKKDRSCETEKF